MNVRGLLFVNDAVYGQVPQAVCMMILNLMTSPSPWQQIDFRLAATVFNILVMINSSSNFVLYSSLSTKFRRTFSGLFCVRCRYGADAAGKGSLMTVPGQTLHGRARARNDYRLVNGRQTQL